VKVVVALVLVLMGTMGGTDAQPAESALRGARTAGRTHAPASELDTSERAAALLRAGETLQLLPYDDPHYCTIGYGHLIAGQQSCAELRLDQPELIARLDGGITAAEAEQLFTADLEVIAEAGVEAWIAVPLAQHEFDALVLLAFNGGRDTLGYSEALRHEIDRGQERDESAIRAEWDFGLAAEFTASLEHLSSGPAACPNATLPGLCARRAHEAELFLTGTYPSSLGYPTEV
jgi:GH24 family phage-related lysozyme (muramidase)